MAKDSPHSSESLGDQSMRLLEIQEQMRSLATEFINLSRPKQPFIPGRSHVPVSAKVVGVEESSAIIQSALDGWFTTGRFNDAFEGELRRFLGVRKVLTVNSGSSANLVATAALTVPELGERALKPGDEVITVAASFPTTINPMLLYGAVPVFVDIDLATGNIQADAIESAISGRTKAIIVAHTLGNPFDATRLQAIAQRHNLWLVEDCCDALGARIEGRHVGSFGDIGTLSFYPAHHITTGEGGAVFTNSPILAKVMESFRDWGRDCWCPSGKDNTCGKRFCWKLGQLPEGYDHKYIYSRAGFNLKITDMQASLGLAQMARLSSFIETRRENHAFLRESLSVCEKDVVLPSALPNAEPSWFGFLITLRPESNISRRKVIDQLTQRNIGTRLLFAGDVRKQPYFSSIPHRSIGELPQTETIIHQTFWVGVTPAIDADMRSYLADSLIEILRSAEVRS